MGARQKLNASYFNGSLFVAAIVGGATGSWLVFFLSLAILVAINVYCNEIRPRKHAGRGQKTT